MIRIRTRSTLFFTRDEVWFNESHNPQVQAYNNLFYQSSVVAKEASKIKSFLTSVIKLDKPEENITAGYKKNYRNEIRKCEKLLPEFSIACESSSDLFAAYLESNTRWSNSRFRKTLNIKRMKAILDAGFGKICRASIGDDDAIYHFYIVSGDRARLLTSHNKVGGSSKVQGLINKLLHHHSILHFKDLGYLVYDFGGLDPENTPGIAKFKRGFGGEEEQTYNFSIRRNANTRKRDQ